MSAGRRASDWMNSDPGRSPKPHSAPRVARRGCVEDAIGVKALLIVLTALLVLVNAFFVIAEYALVRSRRARLELLAEEGSRGARLALGQLDSIGDYISACQVGITMASIGIGALGEPAIAARAGADLRQRQRPRHRCRRVVW